MLRLTEDRGTFSLAAAAVNDAALRADPAVSTVAEHSPPLPSTTIALRCLRLRSTAILPAYQTAGAAGMDLCACAENDDEPPITLLPGARKLVKTGLALAIPDGYEGQVRPRSGLALKQGMTLLNSPGTIDSDYRGEVGVILINLGEAPVTIKPGDRIAQLVICPVTRAALREVEVLDETIRGAGGFGHTGVSDPAREKGSP